MALTVAKFQDYARRVLRPEQIREVMHRMTHLEELSTLQPLISNLTQASVAA